MTSLLFLLFDWFVRRRSDQVMKAALRQNAIISSLFPKVVQQQMMAEVDENHKLSRMGKAGIKNFLVTDNEPGDARINEGKSKPIAGKYRLHG